ncbi:MAG: MTH1187 family thiamine-binding protein [candidate division Zixibacteria bacterium]|nr:MTH1187 family thiamine-binding protein [candidate division Zixibacteria bacterium]
MLVSFSIFPLDKGESVGKYVAKMIDIVDRSGLPYRTSAMSTVVEGSWDSVFKVIKRCHQTLMKGSKRVYVVITIDDRKGARNRLKGKVDRIEQVLKRKIER